ncbi:MAG: cysteine--tRNA ligase [bacterium]|nr:cysteine--tRNA ligase [bacterium]
MKLYNSLTRTTEEFVPLKPPTVGLYTCGQTVYDYTHIGHGRKYVGDDILRRVLARFGYQVTHVQNVTDVGHLVSDADEGEDKLEKGAAKTGKTVWEVAEYFTKNFYDAMDRLNILRPTIICKATEHIAEQIALIEKLLANGKAYDTPEAVYFDVTKFSGYGSLFGQKLEEKNTAVRRSVKTGEYKKHPADFALWFKRVGRFAGHVMHWDSVFGDGFPGWHIECSAMAMKYLGDTIDIHTGGIEHMAVHHPNEIAQSEGATGKQFVRLWIHHGHLMIDGMKMSKSLGNIVTVDDVAGKNIDPLALRYFYLTAHYKKPINFTWEALANAAKGLEELVQQVSAMKRQSRARTTVSVEKVEKIDRYRRKFDDALSNDLNMPQALAVVWETAKSNIPSTDKYDCIMEFDQVLGLDLGRGLVSGAEEIPAEIEALVAARETYRRNKQFRQSDEVRKELQSKGYLLEDLPTGPRVTRIR